MKPTSTSCLSAAFRVLSHEDQAGFDRLLDTYRAEFSPETEHESFLVDQMAQSRWRLLRFRRFESIALEQLLTGEFDETNPNSRIVARLAEHTTSVLTLVQRMATSAEASYHRANRELFQTRARKLRNEANQAQSWLQQQLRSVPMPDPTVAIPITWRPTDTRPGATNTPAG